MIDFLWTFAVFGPPDKAFLLPQQRGDLHTTPALSYSGAGVTKMLMLRPDDLPRVQAALARYQRAQAALERHVVHSVEQLRRQRAREKAGTRAHGR